MTGISDEPPFLSGHQAEKTHFFCQVSIRLWQDILLDTNLFEINWAATWQNQQNECAPSEDSDQPGHPPSPIRVFAFRMKKPWVLSYPLSAQRRLWPDWADAQADLNLRWAHTHFVGFVMSRLICKKHSLFDLFAYFDISDWKIFFQRKSICDVCKKHTLFHILQILIPYLSELSNSARSENVPFHSIFRTHMLS